MNKKFLGVKLSTYLAVLLCLIAAFALWIFVNLPDRLTDEAGIIRFIALENI